LPESYHCLFQGYVVVLLSEAPPFRQSKKAI
jgi:hypothetical protein